MNHAIIENGVVINLIWLYEGNAQEFPNAVALGDRPVAIGDSYADGVFSRDGEPVLTEAEQIADMQAALALIGVAEEPVPEEEGQIDG